MAKLLYMGSHGVEDPTCAGPVFVAASGARDAGHDATVALVGDGVLLMKEPIAEATVSVGQDLVGKNATMLTPVEFANLCAEATNVVSL